MCPDFVFSIAVHSIYEWQFPFLSWFYKKNVFTKTKTLLFLFLVNIGISGFYFNLPYLDILFNVIIIRYKER